MDKNKNIDSFFQDHLKDAELAPSSGVWEGIAAKLPISSKRRIGMWVWRAAAVLLLFGSGAFWFSQNNEEQVYPDESHLTSTSVSSVGDASVLPPVMHEQEKVLERQIPEVNSKPEKTAVLLSVSSDNKAIETNDDRELLISALQSASFNGFKTQKQDLIASKLVLDEQPKGRIFNDQEHLIIAANKERQKSLRETNASSKWEWSAGVQLASVAHIEGSQSSFQDPSMFAAHEGLNTRLPYGRKYDLVEAAQQDLSTGVVVELRPFKRLGFSSGISCSSFSQVHAQNVNSFKRQALLNASLPTLGASHSGAGAPVSPPVSSTLWGKVRFPDQRHVLQDEVLLMDESEGRVFNADNMSSLYVTTKMKASYIEIPFLLNYRILDKRFSIRLLGGIQTGVFVDGSVVAEQFGEGDLEGLSPYIFNSIGGFSFSYLLGRHLMLSLDPQYKHYLKDFSPEGDMTFKPKVFTVHARVMFNF